MVVIANATIINVPADQPTIQAGIDFASVGDTVLVDTGRYVENINFNAKDIVVGSLIIVSGDTSYISQTVIDGDSSGSVVIFENGEDSTAVLNGFTITNGLFWFGGGIHCEGSSPSLSNLIVSDNVASAAGGIYFESSRSTLSKVIVSGNTATEGGGGIYFYMASPSLVDVTIIGNSANEGGGIACNESSPSLFNVMLSGNTIWAGDINTEILCSWNSSMSLVNVTISGNTIEGSFGIYCGLSSMRLVDVTISGYTAGIVAMGVSLSLANVTLTNNDLAGIGCAGSNLSLINTIIWDDPPLVCSVLDEPWPSSITIAYSDVHGGLDGIVNEDSSIVNWLEGNIDGDPLFVDPTGGDFHLQEGSPCIDAGTAFFIWEDDTLVNLPDTAYNGNNPDMGAFESPYIAAIDEDPMLPVKFALFQNYPNPFNPVTTIKYGFPKESKVTLRIFNILGREVATLVAQHQEAGYHQISWDATGHSSGIYFYQIQAGEFVKVRKMVLLK